MPVRGNILFCPSCNQDQPQINLINCLNCGHDLGAPNVNMVSNEDELIALQKRYDDAKFHAVSNGTDDVVNEFETFFNGNVKTIKNLPFDILSTWILNTGDYQTYHRSVDKGQRLISKPNDDQKRTVIDAFLYGTYGRDISFAALTLNEDDGLFSYGDCSIIFNEDSIKLRSSILEENSYKFVETHKVNLETLDMPLGFRSTWEDKLKLAVSKLYKKFKAGNNDDDFCAMVLLCEGDKNTDDFFEVHIYKELSILAVKNIIIPNPKNKKDMLFVKALESKLPGKVKRT